MTTPTPFFRTLVAACLMSSGVSLVAAQATYTPTPTFFPIHVSSDGSTIVGRDFNANVVVLYDVATGTITPIGGQSTQGGISADGSIAAGTELDSLGNNGPARWDGTSWTTLGGLGGMQGTNFGIAYDASDDGATIVGDAYDPVVDRHAFRWQTASGVMEDLGTIGGLQSGAYGTNADGSVVVGFDDDASTLQPRPVSWPAGPGSGAYLGSLDPSDPTAIGESFAVSGDGNVIVGWSTNGVVAEAFRHENGQMVGLGVVPTAFPQSSIAYATNSDGSIIVGGGGSFFSARGFVWTQQDGLQEAKPLLESFGAVLGYDTIGTVTGLSDNGRVICGTLSFPGGGFVATIPADSPVNYCTAKTSTAGCVATMTTSTPFAPDSGANDYSVVLANAEGQRPGIFFTTTNGPATITFQGGLLCLTPPTKRSPIRFTGGTAGSCDGSFSLLVNTGNLIPPLGTGFDAGPGNTSWVQAWYRSPGLGDGFDSALSDGLEISWN